MDIAKRERLEQAGFRVGTVAEFLGLTTEEEEQVESKLASSTAERTRDEAADVSTVPRSSTS